MRSALDDFNRCAKQLGIFGFDLSEERTELRDHQGLAMASECTGSGLFVLIAPDRGSS
jgi:hypothetical protein